VDLDFDPLRPADTMLVVRTTCTNRDLPSQLRHFGERLSFRLEGAAPLARIRCLRLPTSPIRPPSRRGSYWRLVSHLCLNHLSISDPVEGRRALQEILGLYAYLDPASSQATESAVGRIIDGITSLESRQVVGWLDVHGAGGFCRGVEVTLELDERSYIGTEAFLFASVLERFLGLYVAINSFTQLVVKIQSRPGVLKRWPPRAGEQVLL
jgi:type VI secretion system protein ImpG